MECSVDSCARPHAAKGLCLAHYKRMRKGRPLGPPIWQPGEKPCAVDGCDRQVHARGWCGLHWRRWSRTGDPVAVRRPVRPAHERVLSRCVPGPNECIVWTGGLSKGYGSVSIEGGRGALTHRVVYEALVGPIPEGLTLDHLCRNTRCVNPLHLEPVTLSENSRRQAAALRAQREATRAAS